MYDPHAQTLQKHALDALSDLRAWLWAQHGHLFPTDVASVSREHAQRYAAYLEWFSKIEDALVALDVAGQGLKIALGPAEPAPTRPLERTTMRLATPRPPAAQTLARQIVVAQTVAPQTVAPQTIAPRTVAAPSTQSLACPDRADSDACPPTVRSGTASPVRSVISYPTIPILGPVSEQHAA